jgi:hypothetical protein
MCRCMCVRMFSFLFITGKSYACIRFGHVTISCYSCTRTRMHVPRRKLFVLVMHIFEHFHFEFEFHLHANWMHMHKCACLSLNKCTYTCKLQFEIYIICMSQIEAKNHKNIYICNYFLNVHATHICMCIWWIKIMLRDRERNFTALY